MKKWMIFEKFFLEILIFFWKELLKQLKKNEKKWTFLGMLLGTLGASLLGNISTRKEMLMAGYGNKEGQWIVRAGYGNEMDFQCCLIL